MVDELLMHVSDYHANLKPGEALRYVKKVDAMEVTNARILTILDGEQILNASGETTRVGGMSRDVAEMKTAMNGGHLAMATRDKLLIVGANGVFAVAVALIVGSV